MNYNSLKNSLNVNYKEKVNETNHKKELMDSTVTEIKIQSEKPHSTNEKHNLSENEFNIQNEFSILFLAPLLGLLVLYHQT
jgi:hypothetical protein